ncbi:MAG TPA: AraC family transcriptional regulator [Ideonella sp.]|uniref:helix-turn-helix transcriptional regulator n=1 Tax=Ideonella sp. TaxID=1929293 RepID=UPI002E306C03|nr:AraC family transcriptional regulator [Ideonella sp.]HEX5685505.1 AraC family transcriptional regulator [Ideonella sp.]
MTSMHGDIDTPLADHLTAALRPTAAPGHTGLGRLPATPPGALAPWQLRRACDWMRTNLGLPISIGDVAAQLGLSPSYFARAFRAATGQPPHQWLLQRRIDLALQLLQQRGLPLGEIAATCGFADQAHFSRVFAARLGMPPSRWRARQPS